MKYFAIDQAIRTGAKVPKGAVELSEAQYHEALQAKLSGRETVVIDGQFVTRDRAPGPDHTWKNGEWAAPPDPEPKPPTQSDFTAGIEAHVDAVARERDYSSAVSAVSYVDDPNPQYDAEARAFRSWRSAVWTYAIDQLGKVIAGERAAPESVEALIAELPLMEWPSK
jgi:hypothetical protein